MTPPVNLIFVIDNGDDYSAHRIYFVEVPREHAAAFEKAALVCRRGHSVIAIADRVTWRDDVHERDDRYLEMRGFLESITPPIAKADWWELPDVYRMRLIDKWEADRRDAFATWRDVETHLCTGRVLRALKIRT